MATDGELPQSAAHRCRPCETNCCNLHWCTVVAPCSRIVPPVPWTATPSRQTSRQHHRRYRSSNCVWKFVTVVLLVNIVLVLPTSVAWHGAAAPLHDGLILNAVSAMDVARKFDRPANDVYVTASTVFPAEFSRTNSSVVLRDTVRQAVSGTMKNGKVDSRAQEENANETPRSPRGMSVPLESEHTIAESSRTSVAPRSAEYFTETPKGRIVVRRDALSDNDVTIAGPPTASSENSTSDVPNSTTQEHAPTELEDTTDDLLEILRKAIEAAFTTAQIDTDEETSPAVTEPTFNVTTLATASADHSLSTENSPSEPMGHTSANEPTTTVLFAINSTASSNPKLPSAGAAFQENISGSTVGQLLAWAIPVTVLGAVAIVGVVVAIAFIRKRRGSLLLNRGGRNDSDSAAAEAARSGGDFESVGSP